MTSGIPSDPGRTLTPEEERRAITEMAMADLAEQRGGVPITPVGYRPGAEPPEVMRDRALGEFLERRERLLAEQRRRAAERPRNAAPPAAPAARFRDPAPAEAPAAPAARTDEVAAESNGETTGATARALLSSIRGIGPAKQQALLAHFGSIEAIRRASVADIAEAEGIGRATAKVIKESLSS